jgi:DNA-binding MarR family transcriptional regulator
VSEIAEREQTLASRLRLAVVRLNRRLRAQTTDSAMTLSQFSALSTLTKAGAMTPGELAAREGVQPPSMTRLIAGLEEAGLVLRRPHPTDGRQAIVEPTEGGRDRVWEEVTARERWLDHQLADLSTDDREVLCRAVDLIDRIAAR